MNDKVCRFETTFEGKKIIKNNQWVNFSFYKRTRLRERKLKILTDSPPLESKLSVSIISVLEYPRKETSSAFFSSNVKLFAFIDQLITNSILHLILDDKIELVNIEDSYEFLNGLTEDVNDLFLLTLKEDISPTDWIETGIEKALLNASDNNEKRVPLPAFSKQLIDQLLPGQKYYPSAYKEIVNRYLSRGLKKYKWVTAILKSDKKWYEAIDEEVIGVDITNEMTWTLQRDLEKVNTRIQEAIAKESSLALFATQIKEMVSTHILNRTDSD